MDANKRLKLLEIEYTITPSCGTCTHSQFRSGSNFGTCQLLTYEHEKHTEATRQLSIHRYGSCPEQTPSDSFERTIDLWREFVP